MPAVSSTGIGRYSGPATTERDLLWLPAKYLPRAGGGSGGQKIGVVYCHAYGERADDCLSGGTMQGVKTNEANLLRAIAEVYPLVVADMGVWQQGGTLDSNGLGNLNAQARVLDAISWLQSPNGGGAKPGKVHLTGISMGHLTSMTFAQNHPQLVASISAALPAIDLDDIRDNDRGGGTFGGTDLRQAASTAWAAGGQASYTISTTSGSAAITATGNFAAGDSGKYISGPNIPLTAGAGPVFLNTAGGTTAGTLSSSSSSAVAVNATATGSGLVVYVTPRWTANGTPALPAGANPALTANQTNIGNIPQKLWYANDDAICVPATVTALKTNMPNITIVNLGNVGGHTDQSVGYVPIADLLAFLAAAS